MQPEHPVNIETPSAMLGAIVDGQNLIFAIDALGRNAV